MDADRGRGNAGLGDWGGSSEGGGACLPPEEDMLTGLGGIAPEDLSVEMGSLVNWLLHSLESAKPV